MIPKADDHTYTYDRRNVNFFQMNHQQHYKL